MTTSDGAAVTLPYVALTREEIDRAELARQVWHPGAGAVVTFDGVVRDHARGKTIRYLEYEAYEEMALERLAAIARTVQERWATDHIAIVHRLGHLEVGETSVVVVVATAHRGDAFDACRYAIDTLKTTVPIWKREVATDGEAWVEG